ncbi:MAG: hypothetical protein CBD16_08505 [Betaproteobacteria bacterium TMED156]|nr:MAG: hypothetical protein CBD16_08505 [Betaproteobacteria bacterium TMED156]
MKIERKIDGISLELGESPVWVKHLHKFFFIDIRNPKIYSYEPFERKLQTFSSPFCFSCIDYVGKNLFLLASGNKILKTDDKFQDFKEHCTVDFNLVGKRFNDGSFDGFGNFWISGIQSNGDNLSSIFKISLNKKIEIFEKNSIKLGNGIDWSPNKQLMYFNDSKAKLTYCFNFDKNKQVLSNKKIFFDFNDFFGEPDGLTVDADGALWIPVWDAGIITKISKNGELLNSYNIPSLRPTSVSFANDNKNTMLITTAQLDVNRTTVDGSIFIGTKN